MIFKSLFRLQINTIMIISLLNFICVLSERNRIMQSTTRQSPRDFKTVPKISILICWRSMHPVWSFYCNICRTKSYWDEIKIINHSNFWFIPFIWFIRQDQTEWNQVLFRYPTKSGLLYRIYYQTYRYLYQW